MNTTFIYTLSDPRDNMIREHRDRVSLAVKLWWKNRKNINNNG